MATDSYAVSYTAYLTNTNNILFSKVGTVLLNKTFQELFAVSTDEKDVVLSRVWGEFKTRAESEIVLKTQKMAWKHKKRQPFGYFNNNKKELKSAHLKLNSHTPVSDTQCV